MIPENFEIFFLNVLLHYFLYSIDEFLNLYVLKFAILFCSIVLLVKGLGIKRYYYYSFAIPVRIQASFVEDRSLVSTLMLASFRFRVVQQTLFKPLPLLKTNIVQNQNNGSFTIFTFV